jgi:hypothetical protein
MCETMASFTLVEHANGAMFDPRWGRAIYPRTVVPNRRPYRTSDLEPILLPQRSSARQHISVSAAPCLPLMRSART